MIEDKADRIVATLDDVKGYSIEIVKNTVADAYNPYQVYVTLLGKNPSYVAAKAVWDQYQKENPQDYQNLLGKFSGLERAEVPKRLYGTDSHDRLYSIQGGALYGGDGNDSFLAVQGPGEDKIKQLQSHIWAGEGNDTITMNFIAAKNPNNKTSGLVPTYGNHFSGNGGNDTFIIKTNNVNNTVVGRFEDFDYSRDTIIVDNQKIDLKKIDSYSNVRIVEYGGTFGVPGAEPQQWLLINAKGGGHVFYALEGARTYASNQVRYAAGRVDEEHFVIKNKIGALEKQFDKMKSVAYVDPQNTVPAGVSTAGKDIIIDKDSSPKDISNQILGDAGEYARNPNDLIAAGLNDDLVKAQVGDDGVWGGSGRDTIYGGSGQDVLYGGTGNDRLYGDDGRDTLYGDNGDDWLIGGNGNDLLFGGAGQDKFYGGSGNDTVSYADSNEGVFVDMTGKHQSDDNRFISIEVIMGSDFKDSIFGDGRANYLMGGRDDDAIYGRQGNDTIIGGEGKDGINGGSGFDMASYADARSGVTANLQKSELNRGDAYGDKYASIEGLEGTQNNDRLFGDGASNQLVGLAGRDYLDGQAGNDSLYGGASHDTILGGAGNDRLYADDGRDNMNGQAGNDSLYGGNDKDFLRGWSENDYLDGGAGDDRLLGDDGNDRLMGGAGKDLITGGRGADVFIFAGGDGVDRITDFKSSEDHLQFARSAGLNARNLDDHAKIVGNQCIIDYVGGSLTLSNVNDVDDLSGAILFA